MILGLFGDDNQRIERGYVNLQKPLSPRTPGFYLDSEWMSSSIASSPNGAGKMKDGF